MAVTMGDKWSAPVGSYKPWGFLGCAKITFATGGTGDSGTVTGMSDVTCTRTGVGVYNLTFPASPRCMIFYSLAVGSVVDTVNGTAFSDTAGTGTFTLKIDTGVATDSSANDVVCVLFFSETRGG